MRIAPVFLGLLLVSAFAFAADPTPIAAQTELPPAAINPITPTRLITDVAAIKSDVSEINAYIDAMNLDMSSMHGQLKRVETLQISFTPTALFIVLFAVFAQGLVTFFVVQKLLHNYAEQTAKSFNLTMEQFADKINSQKARKKKVA